VKILFRAEAIEEIAIIEERIALGSPAAAERWVLAFKRRVLTLHQFPRAGRMVPEHQDKELRELILGNYRIWYRLTDAIRIVAVWDARRGDLPDRVREDEAHYAAAV
jgi:toxin ParE1/3/4